MEDKDFEPRPGGGGYQNEKTPLWFVILTILVAAWAAYYVFEYWGGLGPGIGY